MDENVLIYMYKGTYICLYVYIMLIYVRAMIDIAEHFQGKKLLLSPSLPA
jgi:hypothetical protein